MIITTAFGCCSPVNVYFYFYGSRHVTEVQHQHSRANKAKLGYSLFLVCCACQHSLSVQTTYVLEVEAMDYFGNVGSNTYNWTVGK